MGTLNEFKDFVIGLITGLVRDRDAEITSLKADLATASGQLTELRAALANAETEKAAALTAQLTDLTAQLQAQFQNPSPASDQVNQAIVDTPLVPEVVETPIETGSAEPTPMETTEANIQALGEAIAQST